ncbi:hypothetical protein AVEN_8460-1 [Araneus ventricosus]|uniref:Uncharacterized protein n=1 Tax=Araneus ventricosus TaxID=182803 RepID=A0A4Y2EUT0_ARAVE|nr:hypothetical protein AVEN_8460-1 [Araneus ventricosus]
MRGVPQNNGTIFLLFKVRRQPSPEPRMAVLRRKVPKKKQDGSKRMGTLFYFDFSFIGPDLVWMPWLFGFGRMARYRRCLSLKTIEWMNFFGNINQNRGGSVLTTTERK